LDFHPSFAGEVTPKLTQTEFELRRHRLMGLVASQSAPSAPSPHAVVVLSHPTHTMSNDIPYPFHQNPDLLYLCGFAEPDSALLLVSGSPSPRHRSLLFVPPRDPGRELWDGPRSGTDGAASLTGVQEACPTAELGRVLQQLAEDGCTLWYDEAHVTHPKLHDQFLRPLLEARGRSGNGLQVRSPRALLHSLRAVKSTAEIELMKEAGRITAQAFRKTMGACEGPVDESFLFAKVREQSPAGGANFLAYLPVVAGGNRANTLHYVNNNQLIKDGEMVLLDGGCEYFGYVSDITRTWPINGRFSSVQAVLYQAVLDVQKSCVALCTPGVSLENIYSSMQRGIRDKLRELGIVQGREDELSRAASRYCPHHVGHYLGMDVHDTPEVSRTRSLQPGMVITIEPGIYIPEDDQSAPPPYRGLGVRIEDNVLITEEGGPLILSADTPKEIADIERVCAGGD
ncbi:xaa-Pro aminopeptidase 3, partial [Polyodon spathula]|uniref:xaa-Pro aminopeptidase 3 n=1 Tax=Polyodon spathula TaxID=7913 RepID=UPI001B7F6D9D